MPHAFVPRRPGPERRFVAWALVSQVCVVVVLVVGLLLAPSRAPVATVWAWTVPLAVAVGERWNRRRFALPVAVVGALAFALTASPVAALVLAAAGGGRLARRVAAGLPRALDGTRRTHRLRTVLFVLVTLLALVRGTSLTAFMTDEERTWGAAVPALGEGGGHQCLAAYLYAGELSTRGVDDVYDPRLYPSPLGDADPAPEAMVPVRSSIEGLAEVVEDAFLYPPPFLLLSRLALHASHDYALLRAAAFALNALAFLACFVVLATWIGGPLGLRAGLLLPILWITLPVQLNLQFGQFHLLAIGLSSVAMVAFERSRPSLGGALLALAVVGKVFPGVLVLWLVFRREWRPLAWTVGWCLVWTGAALAVVGVGAFEAFFVTHVPRLADGEFVPGFQESSDVVGMNVALASLPFKLAALGWIEEPSRLFAPLAWGGRVLVVVLALRAARRVTNERHALAMTWLALLALAALQAPFVPSLYGYSGVLWLWCSVVPLAGRKRRYLAAAVVAFLLLSPTPPFLPDQVVVLGSLTGALLSIGLAIVALLLAERRRTGAPVLARAAHGRADGRGTAELSV